jgi:dihydroorotase
MPNTNPVIDNMDVVNQIEAKSKLINILVAGSITKGQDGRELSELVAHVGVIAISEDGKTVEDSNLMKQALQSGKLVLAHCEDEEKHAARDIELAKDIANAKLHICHISARKTLELVRNAQNVTAEAAPHHFVLYDDNSNDTNRKMNPPLRTKDDMLAMKEGLRDGSIAVIATDHAPHTVNEKSVAYEDAPNGVIGLETAFPVSYTELVVGGWLTPVQLIEKMTYNPARILGIDRGHLSVGADADIAVIDVENEYVINSGKFKSKSRNTPFGGWKVKGFAEYTICGGVIHDNRQAD